MTDNPSGLPPAGWYPDPYGAPYERWWDGAQWTEHTTPPAAPEPAQPTYQAPVEPVQQAEPVSEQPSYEQPTPEQPSYEQPSYEQPTYALPTYEQPSYQPGGFGEQPSYQEPAYEEPEYEQTYEATQQQPSPSWGSPVSAAAATPGASFDDLFGSKPAAEEPTSAPSQDNPFSFGAPVAAEPAQPAPMAEPAPATPAPVTAEPAFTDLFGANTRDAERPVEQPAAEPFGGPATSSQATGEQLFSQQPYAQQPYSQQTYSSQSYSPEPSAQPATSQPAANDDFGMLLAGGSAASGQPGAAAGDSGDTFSTWSNEEYVDPPRNSAATASLTFGVLSFVIPVVAGLLGLVFGVVGVMRSRGFAADGEGPVGRTKSFAGIALSIIGSAVSIALVLFVLPGIINPTSDGAAAGSTTEDGSSIVAAAPATPNGGISLAEGDLATITFPGTDDPSIQFSVTGITPNPTCTEDPELVLSPDNGQFVAITMTFTTSADYASQMATGGLLLVSPTDFAGYLSDGTSILSSDAGISCIPEAEQLPDGIPAGETVTATMILDLSEAVTSIAYSPVGVTDLDTAQTFWEWPIAR